MYIYIFKIFLENTNTWTVFSFALQLTGFQRPTEFLNGCGKNNMYGYEFLVQSLSSRTEKQTDKCKVKQEVKHYF